MTKVPPTSKFLHATPAKFVGRLKAMNEGWRWRWNVCGPDGASTVFSWVGDLQMRNAVGITPGQYPLIKIAASTWDCMELWSCGYTAWRLHILGTRGARASDAEFFRTAWICLDLPMAQVAPEPEKHHEH